MPAFARNKLLRLVAVSAFLILMAGLAAAEDRGADEAAPYRILVTNDDGIDSPGLAALVEVLSPLGEVMIVAPLENQSGIGHGLNLRRPIFIRKHEVAGYPATALIASPATCVRVTLAHLFKGSPPDLIVSGVNRGLNFGRNAYISGTVAAAREAALQGIPAIAASMATEGHPDYAAAAAATAEVAAMVKDHGLPDGVFLNVSVPVPATKGIKVARQSRLAGTETYEEHNTPYGRPYLWSVFHQPTAEPESGSDIAAVRDGYVAVTPLQASESAESALESLAAHFNGAEP